LAEIRLFDGNPFVQGARSAESVFKYTIVFIYEVCARCAENFQIPWICIISIINLRKNPVSCFEDFPLRKMDVFLQNGFLKIKTIKNQFVSTLTARSRQHVNFPQRTH